MLQASSSETPRSSFIESELSEIGFVKERYPEVIQKLSDFRFPGQGQRKTPMTCAKGVIEIVMLLPGRMAAQVRRQASELLCRYEFYRVRAVKPLPQRHCARVLSVGFLLADTALVSIVFISKPIEIGSCQFETIANLLLSDLIPHCLAFPFAFCVPS